MRVNCVIPTTREHSVLETGMMGDFREGKIITEYGEFPA